MLILSHIHLCFTRVLWLVLKAKWEESSLFQLRELTLQSQFNFYSISSPCYFSPQPHQGLLDDSWNNPAFAASQHLGPACFSCLKHWCVATQTLCAGWVCQPFVFKHNKFTVAQQCPQFSSIGRSSHPFLYQSEP